MDANELGALERAARAATPQDIDTAQIIGDVDGKYIDCPCCDGEGSVALEGDYCNYDGTGIGVQFYGIGKEFGAAERFLRAANPAAIIELIRSLRDMERQRDGLLSALKNLIPLQNLCEPVGRRSTQIIEAAIAAVEPPEAAQTADAVGEAAQ